MITIYLKGADCPKTIKAVSDILDPGGDVIIDDEPGPWITRSTDEDGMVNIVAKKDAAAGLFPMEEARLIGELVSRYTDSEMEHYVATDFGWQAHLK